MAEAEAYRKMQAEFQRKRARAFMQKARAEMTEEERLERNKREQERRKRKKIEAENICAARKRADEACARYLFLAEKFADKLLALKNGGAHTIHELMDDSTMAEISLIKALSHPANSHPDFSGVTTIDFESIPGHGKR